MAPRLVMLRPLGLGDFLTGVPAYRALARAYPAHQRLLAAPVALAPLARASGAIDAVINTAPLKELEEALCDADVAVDLHGKGPASHRILIRARPRKLMAFRCDEVVESWGGPPWQDDEHEAERWCRMLRWYGVPADARDLYLNNTAVRRSSFPDVVLLHPGAASESRRWPVERWTRLACSLRGAGWRVLLTGNAQEFLRCRTIAKAAQLPISHVLAGKTDLRALTNLVGVSRAIICGDTGVAHLATALRIPSVVLFGPTPPALWGPPKDPRHRVIWREGRGDPHGDRIDERLAAIAVDDVLTELAAALSNEADRPLEFEVDECGRNAGP